LGAPRFVFQHGTAHSPRGGARGQNTVPHASPLRGCSRGAAWVLACAAAAARAEGCAAVRSCAGAYVSGAAGSNACPAGSVRIVTEAACRTAVTAAGKNPGHGNIGGDMVSSFLENIASVPRGCYTMRTNNDAFFNTHAVGAGSSSSQLLCAASGAPPRPMRAPVCTSACSGSTRVI
jgi:hypothetical protein